MTMERPRSLSDKFCCPVGSDKAIASEVPGQTEVRQGVNTRDPAGTIGAMARSPRMWP
jgi:hypothetical protein